MFGPTRTAYYEGTPRTQYPLECRPRMRQVSFDTNDGQTVAPHGALNGWDRLRYLEAWNRPDPDQSIEKLLACRSEVRQALRQRKYKVHNVTVDDFTLEKVLGFNPAEGGYFRDSDYREGPVMDMTRGFIEVAHVPKLEYILHEVRKSAKRLLDMGCGRAGIRKLPQEGIVDDVVYASNCQEELDALEVYLADFGQESVRREFVHCDKSEAGERFRSQTFGAILRLGVFETSGPGMQGYASILDPRGVLLVSNNLLNQPIGQFLDHVEPHFKSIEAHIGLSRYLLECRKPRK